MYAQNGYHTNMWYWFTYGWFTLGVKTDFLSHKVGICASHWCEFWINSNYVTPRERPIFSKEICTHKIHDPTWSKLKQWNAPFLECWVLVLGPIWGMNIIDKLFEVVQAIWLIGNLNGSLSSSLHFALCNGLHSLASRPLDLAEFTLVIFLF